MKIGYIRYLKNNDCEQQKQILSCNGCKKIIISSIDKQSCWQLKSLIKSGDLLVVVSIADLASSTSSLFKLIDFIINNSIRLQCLNEKIQLPRDKYIFMGLIKFEKKIAQERATKALSIAKKKGKTGGRKRISDNIIKEIKMLSVSDKSVNEICKILNISRSTYYKYYHFSGASLLI